MLCDEKYVQRYALFTFKKKSEIPDYVWSNMNPFTIVMGIGTKNYSDCNGVIYSHRHNKNYLKQTIQINPNFYIVNN